MHTLLISDNLYLHSIYIKENAIKTILKSSEDILLNPKSLEQLKAGLAGQHCSLAPDTGPKSLSKWAK